MSIKCESEVTTMELIKVDKSSCTKCGICTEVCPPGVLSMGANGSMAIEPQICMACGHCVAACSCKAIDNIRTPLTNQIDLEEFPVINEITAQNFLKDEKITGAVMVGYPKFSYKRLVDRDQLDITWI